MKHLSISILVILLSVLVLLGSGSLTIGKMICSEHGHASYFMGNANDCCENNDAKYESFEEDCCAFVNVSLALDAFAPSSKISAYAYELYLPLPVFEFSFLSSNFRLQTFFHGVQPPSIKEDIHFLCSLLI